MIHKTGTTPGRHSGLASSIHPADAASVIAEHLLVDVLDFTLDLKKSEGSYIYDSKSGRRLLDFFTFVASMPIGLNHPKMTTPEFLEKLGAVAVNQPTNSDVFTPAIDRKSVVYGKGG